MPASPSFLRRSRCALAAVLALAAGAAGAAPSLAHPGHLSPDHAGRPGVTSPFAVPFPVAGPSMGGYSSPNVEFVKNIAKHADTAGGRKLGDFFYITTERDLTIYDVSTPVNPVEVGSVPLPDPGTPVFTEEDPDTNGRILLVSNRGRLSVIDVTNKRAPKVLSSLANADQHTITCVLDCTWAYGSEGKIIDLRDPAKPRLSASSWRTPDIESTHDVTEVSPGIILTSTQPLKLLDARTDPEKPTVLAATPKQAGRFVHANLWPRGGVDDFLLVGGEATGPGCSDDVSATFSTWDAREFRATGVTRQLDEFRLGPGLVTEGRAPESSYCVHWFDPHPYYVNGGLVAISWYEHGTHFLKIDKDGKISEVGYFLGGGGQASAAYWIDERTVYVADYLRGLDVVRFTGDIGSPPAGGGGADQTPQPPSQAPGQTQSQAEFQGQVQGPLATAASPSCVVEPGFGSTSVQGRGRGLVLAFSKTAAAAAKIDVLQQSSGSKVIDERLVARFTDRSDDVTWNGRANVPGRRVTDGYYFVRYQVRTPTGTDTRRIALRRLRGRWTGRPSFSRRSDCDLVRQFKLERPVFGGSTDRSLAVTYQVQQEATVTLTVLRGTRVVRRLGTTAAAPGRTYRVLLGAAGLRRGDYRVRVAARRGAQRVSSLLISRRV
jgi:hypothetical protein